MLVAPAAKFNPALLALKPRQVSLSSSSAMKNKGGRDKNGHDVSSGKVLALTVDQKLLLHQSIASYLERCGFSKSLKKFRSEAKFQEDDSKNSSIDLEEMCLIYLAKGKDSVDSLNNQKDQDGKGYVKTNVDKVCKKKTEKITETDINAEISHSEVAHNNGDSVHGEIVNNGVTGSKSKKKKSSALGEEADKNLSDNITDESLKGLNSRSKKKKKSKLDADSVEQLHHEVPPVGQSAASHKSEKDLKDKKEKKVKSTSDSIVEVETESQENRVLKVGKKKKKGISENCVKEDLKELQHDANRDIPATNHSKTSNGDATAEKKKSKKRKRPVSEDEPAVVDGKKNEMPQNGKVETFKESPENQQPEKVVAADEQDNKDVEKPTEKSSTQRPAKKQRNGSEEPKTVRAFQRVKVDQISYADERLQDNSYWSIDAEESGYGAKAQEILGQVKGRDFRHEKTKKKRGTYRGGKIELDSHSVKFSYSDDE